MSRSTVKAEINSNKPDEVLKIAGQSNKQHIVLGPDSPVKHLDMTTFNALVKSAEEKRAEAKRLHEQAEILNQSAMLDLGLTKNQNSKTPGTVYSILTSIRDILLGTYKGQEEKMNEWGFKVITGTVVRNKKVK